MLKLGEVYVQKTGWQQAVSQQGETNEKGEQADTKQTDHEQKEGQRHRELENSG